MPNRRAMSAASWMDFDASVIMPQWNIGSPVSAGAVEYSELRNRLMPVDHMP